MAWHPPFREDAEVAARARLIGVLSQSGCYQRAHTAITPNGKCRHLIAPLRAEC